MFKVLSWILNKLRFRRLALSSSAKLLDQFSICQGSYSNWKHDPRPLIFIMYSGPKYTHAININYLTSFDKSWFARTLYLLKRGNQILDGVAMYRFLKLRRISIIKTAYRIYFTALLDMKAVSKGLSYAKNIYPTGNSWVLQLNELLKPSEMGVSLEEGRPQISYDPVELQNRIAQVTNAIPLNKRAVYSGPAQWLRK